MKLIFKRWRPKQQQHYNNNMLWLQLISSIDWNNNSSSNYCLAKARAISRSMASRARERRLSRFSLFHSSGFEKMRKALVKESSALEVVRVVTPAGGLRHGLGLTLTEW